MTISPFDPLRFPRYPLNNITPFTYRDGRTFLEVLEELRRYITNTIVPGIDANFDTLVQNYLDALATLQSQYAGFTATADGKYAEFTATADGKYAALETLHDQYMANVVARLAVIVGYLNANPPSAGGAEDVPLNPSAYALMVAAVASAASTPCRIVFIGSSTTANSSYVDGVRVRLQRRWPNGGEESTVQRDASNIITSPGVHCYNFGIAGTEALNYVPATVRDNIAAVQPSIVIHGIGANDWALNVSPYNFRARMEAALASIDGVLTKPALHIFVHQHPRGDGPFRYAWSDYAITLAEIAADAPERRMLIDTTPVWGPLGVPSPDPYDLLDDVPPVHLTPAGAQTLADAVATPLTAINLAQTTPALTPTMPLSPPFVPDGYTVVTSDSFHTDGPASSTPTDARWGGEPVTPVVTSGSVISSGRLSTMGSGRIVYPMPAAKPHYIGARVLITNVGGNEGVARIFALRPFMINNGLGNWEVSVRQGGVLATSNGETAVQTIDGVKVVPGDYLGIQLDGTTLTVSVNGTVVHTRTDATNQTIAGCGVVSYWTGQWFLDDVVAAYKEL